MRLSDFYPEMQGWKPVETPVVQNLQPQVPNEQTQVSGNLRTTLPLPLQYSGDTVKQYNRPGQSSFRIAPLPPGGIPAINSASASVTKTVIEQTNSVGAGILLQTDGINNAIQNRENLIAGTNIELVPDLNGGTTFNVQSSSPQWPLPNTAVAYMARAIVGQTALQCIGDNSPNTSSAGTGGVANGTVPTSTDGVSVQISSSSVNSAFGWNASGGKVTWMGRNVQFQARANITQLTGGVFWIGLTDQIADNLRTLTPLGNTVAFLIGGGVPPLQGVIIKGAVITSIALTGSIVGSTSYKIIMDDTANTTTFYIDEVVAGTITGHNFAAGVWPTVSLWQNNAGLPAANVDYFYAQQDF